MLLALLSSRRWYVSSRADPPGHGARVRGDAIGGAEEGLGWAAGAGVGRARTDRSGGHLYVFRNRREDSVNVLFFDRPGYAVFHKRVSQVSFHVPVATDGTSRREVDTSELMPIHECINLRGARRAKRWSPPPVVRPPQRPRTQPDLVARGMSETSLAGTGFIPADQNRRPRLPSRRPDRPPSQRRQPESS